RHSDYRAGAGNRENYARQSGLQLYPPGMAYPTGRSGLIARTTAPPSNRPPKPDQRRGRKRQHHPSSDLIRRRAPWITVCPTSTAIAGNITHVPYVDVG